MQSPKAAHHFQRERRLVYIIALRQLTVSVKSVLAGNTLSGWDFNDKHKIFKSIVRTSQIEKSQEIVNTDSYVKIVTLKNVLNEI